MKRFSHSIGAKAYQPSNPAKALGGRWTRMRNIHLMQNPICCSCGKPADVVHHVIPRAVDPTKRFDWSNLASMCHACHSQTHRELNKKHYRTNS